MKTLAMEMEERNEKLKLHAGCFKSMLALMKAADLLDDAGHAEVADELRKTLDLLSKLSDTI